MQERLNTSRNFQQGFATVEFLASGFVDMDFHKLSAGEAGSIDVAGFESRSLERIGALPEIPMRHRSAHFASAAAQSQLPRRGAPQREGDAP